MKEILNQEKFDPVGNTGSNSQSASNKYSFSPDNSPLLQIGLDWLNITTCLPDEDTVIEFLNKVASAWDEHGALVLDYEKQWHCGQTYHHSARTPNGIRCGWTNLHAPTQSHRVLVSIPGQAMAHVFQENIHRHLVSLSKQYPLKFTRVDIACDDYSKSLSFDDIRAAINSRNCSGFKPETSEFIESSKGRTIYMGSRSSDKFVRFYDKNLESKGEYNCYRWEQVLKDYKSEQFMNMYLSVPVNGSDDANELIIALLRETCFSQLRFVDRSSGDKNLSRCDNLIWWDEWLYFVGASGSLKLKCRKRQSSLISKVRWLQHQVETSIAMVRDVLGAIDFKQWLNNRVESGRLRYNKMHEAIIHEHKRYSDTRSTLRVSALPL